MKIYIRTILISAFLLLIFPFLGFSELWEHIYVIILGFIIGTSTLFFYKKINIKSQIKEAPIEKLNTIFNTNSKEQHSSRISDVQLDNKE